jgi:hypothetical protein
MKLRSGLISAIAVSVLTLAALTGVTGAAPASAATPPYHHLCLRENNATVSCIQAQGAGQPIVMANPSRSDLTNWVYPANGDTGLIQQAHTNLCMQLNWDASVIIEATCNSNLTYQLWENGYDSKTRRTLFESTWAYYNEGFYAYYIAAYGTYYGAEVGVQEDQFSGGYDQWGSS